MVLKQVDKHHARNVVIVLKQWWEHGNIHVTSRQTPCSECCHRLVTMVGAWYYNEQTNTMLRVLSSPSNNGGSMLVSQLNKYQSQTVVIA